MIRYILQWHLGFFKSDYTPTNRGFDSFFGYWLGAGDYWDHSESEPPGWGLDLRNNTEVIYSKTRYLWLADAGRVRHFVLYKAKCQCHGVRCRLPSSRFFPSSSPYLLVNLHLMCYCDQNTLLFFLWISKFCLRNNRHAKFYALILRILFI